MKERIAVDEGMPQSLAEDLLEIANYIRSESVGKTYLITGGNGFVAYYITLSLLLANDKFDLNNRVVLLVRNEKRARAKYGALADRGDLSFLVQDVCSPLDTALSFDYIIHAASSADASHFDADPIGVFNANVIGTENVIRFLKEHECLSTVFVSSFTVYGETSSTTVVDEKYKGVDSWDNNRACYSYGKRCSEFLCMAAWKMYGSPIRIVRPGFIYGASSREDKRVYAEIINCVSDGLPITLQSPGHVFRSMVYVTDVVRGIFRALYRGENGEAYNIANEFVSIREFAKAAVRAAAPGVELRFLHAQDEAVPPPEAPCGCMDNTKIRSVCGWEPKVAIEAGIKMSTDIIEWKDSTITA